MNITPVDLQHVVDLHEAHAAIPIETVNGFDVLTFRCASGATHVMISGPFADGGILITPAAA